MTERIVFRAGPHPCFVCGTPSKGCSATEDGLYFCRGEPVAGWRRISTAPDAAGFHHYRRDTDPGPTTSPSSRPRGRPRRTAASAPAAGDTGGTEQPATRTRRTNWEVTAQRYRDSLRDEDRTELAIRLHLPADLNPADVLPLTGTSGKDLNGSTFTFPETNAAGKIVGISTRLPPATPGGKEEKKCILGSKRGLFIPAGWSDRPGPLFVVEGASDTIALTLAGLCVVGRSQDTGGAENVAALVRVVNFPADRPIIVVGENDQKEDGKWPGRDGALSVAEKVSDRLAGRPVRVAMPPDGAKDVRAWLTDPARGSSPWLDRGQQLLAHLSNPAAAPVPSATRIKRRTIIAGFNEYEINNEAIAALAESDESIFERGGALVHVAWQDAHKLPNTAVTVPAGPKIGLVSRDTLRERLTVVANWKEERSSAGDSNDKFHMPSRPPDWCVGAVLKRGAWKGIRPLVAISEFPCFLQDGSILSKPGYDESSGLYFQPAVPVSIDVSVSPTEADAAAALEVLAHAVCDFPFVNLHHRSAWLAGLLTPLARYAFAGPSPLFLVEANVPGAGKGLLVNTANLIVRGEASAVLEFSREAEELQKVLTALLIQGESIAMFDNVEGHLGGGVLNKLLTAELWEGRILGTVTTVRVPNLTTWWCTGNNVAVMGDTARRVCSVRLESAYENPEERTDLQHKDLPAWIRANRGSLLSAALTILRAFHAAGRPEQDLRTWGSYVQWSNLIRGAIVWAGWPDPISDGVSVRREDDPTLGAMRVLMEGWTVIDPDRAGLTTARVIEKVSELSDSSAGADELREALEVLAPRSSKSRVRALSYIFREYRRRTIGRFKLDQKPIRQGLIYWFVADQADELFSGGHGVHGGHDSFYRGKENHVLNNTLSKYTPHIEDKPAPCPPSTPCPPVNSNGRPGVIDLTDELFSARPGVPGEGPSP